jgi:hypothetical protein
MITNRTLQRINNRPRNQGRISLLAVGGGAFVLAALLYVLELLPTFAAFAVVVCGLLLVLLLYMRQRAQATISLSYKDTLNNQNASRFAEIREALEGLASSERTWLLPNSRSFPKVGEVVPSPERELATVGLLPTPGIKADVPIWGIEAGEGTLYFFPEGTLLHKDDRYEPVSYNALKMTLSSGRFFEEGDLSADATVVERVWRFSRPDGSPDPRYKSDNVEIPVVLYNLLDMKGPSGLDLRLMVSNRREAARFARAFGARDLREKRRKDDPPGAYSGKASERSSSNGQNREEKHRSAEDAEKEIRLARARKILGVAKGASAEEIGAAYRGLARTHHPDKVAHLEPEVREYSERRMKEINAAYTELKGDRNNRASKEARTG